jgi:hypothetical protein
MKASNNQQGQTVLDSHSSGDLVTPKVLSECQRNHPLAESTDVSNSVEGKSEPSVVLVAKRLTNSDASSGRIILPRVAVEMNLSFVVAYRHYGLNVRDANGEMHEFVVKSWANGSESRRVFVLEGVGKFLKQYHVGVGDVVGICSRGEEFLVEVNTEEVKQAANSTGRSSAASTPTGAAALHRNHKFSFGKPLAGGHARHSFEGVRCSRSSKCTKLPGHPGFCSGPKAATHKGAALAFQQAAISEASSQEMEWSSWDNFGVDVAEAGDDAHQDGVDQVFVDEATVFQDMQQLPDGLQRLIYIPQRAKVVKQLTEYDLSSRRIVLPADQVSSGFLLSEGVSVHTLAAVDESQGWHFPNVRSWKSVTGKSGYFMEDGSGFLAARGARPGDYFMVYRDSIRSPPKMLVLDGDTCQVKRTIHGPDAEIDFLSLPILLLPYGEHRDLSDGAVSMVKEVKRWHQGRLGGCIKSVCCLLEQGHTGNCCFQERKRCRAMYEGSEYESSRTPAHRERRASRFAAGKADPLVSLLHLLE